MSGSSEKHAVVIGGSMAGMLSAAVLARHFDRVTLLERDTFPDEPVVRKGLPQANHIHFLLVRGHDILEEIFPGLDGELDALGVPCLDSTNDMINLGRTGWLPRFASGLQTRTSSRALLDWAVRRRVVANPRIHIEQQCEGAGLIATEDGKRITGVRLERRGAGRSADRTAGRSTGEQVLNADLVVDASGRSSKLPDWLDALGYARPKEEMVNSFLGYASRRYRLTNDDLPDWSLMYIFSRPPEGKRGGAIMREGDTMIATLTGAANDHPPTDEAAFMEYARTLPTPLFYDTIKDAEPAGPIYGYQRTANRVLRYEHLDRWPEGLVVLGDAVCGFNPVYGQGMSTSAMAASVLDACLKEYGSNGSLAGMGKVFQKRLAQSNETPWLLSTAEDLRFPETEGARPNLFGRAMQRYVDGVIQILDESPHASHVFVGVLHLVTPPAALLQPRIALHILRRVLFGRGRSYGLPESGPPPKRSSTVL